MRDILNATGMDGDWTRDSGQGGKPGREVKGVFNQARVRPDWKNLMVARPIFPETTGPYSDFRPLTGETHSDPNVIQQAPDYAYQDWLHRGRVS